MSNILVVEDEAVIRGELARVLRREGHEVTAVEDVPSALDAGPASFDLLLTDLHLPGPSGDTLLDATETPVIVMTAFGSVRTAVDAMKRGAADYLSKPFDPDELVLTVTRVLGRRRLERENDALRRTRPAPTGMVGACAAMRDVFARIEKVAPTNATVLVLGESGTGKELVAKAIHEQSERKASGAFVPVNCASIPENLVESELFGHERGAFTGAVAAQTGLVEAAHEGTLFLDEIGELPASAQARLLRVLQEREVRRVGSNKAKRVDVRLVAATHRNLRAMVGEGTFREDLYFRLKVLEIELPPLRDRGDDVLAIARTLLEREARRRSKGTLTFDEDAEKALIEHEWPGNVRELQNAVERALILHECGPVTRALLGLEPSPVRPSQPPRAELSLEEYFKAFVLEHQGSVGETELARRLGISRKSLWERRQRLGIPRPKKVS
ncbi:MAG: sigma-54 dependent transcriptional regulator [Myxococcota bacterium]